MELQRSRRTRSEVDGAARLEIDIKINLCSGKMIRMYAAAALTRQKERELEQAKLMCSLENKEACLMCSA